MKQILGAGSAEPRDPQTYAIIGAAMEVHRCLGPWFLEPVYQDALAVELGSRGIPHEREVGLAVYYKGTPLGRHYRVDFVCFDDVLVELKAMERLTATEESQVINYLAVCQVGRGLLLNFGARSLQFKRFVGPEHRAYSSSVKSV